MKKALILLLLLPFIGFSQNLVTWNTTSTPTPTTTNVSVSTPMTGVSVSIANNNYGTSNNESGFLFTDFQQNVTNNPNVDYTQYLQFAVKANSGYNMSPSQFKLMYYSPNGNDGAKKIQVRYSTDAAFTGNGTILGSETTLIQGSTQNLNLSFPTGYTVLANSTLYIRLYIYGQNNCCYGQLFLRNTNNTSGQGPTLTGSTASSTGLLAVNDDLNTTETVTKQNFNILSNDVASGTTINTVTVNQPPAGQGTVTLNADNTVNYNPNAYFGTTSFTYVIKSPNNTYTSTGTVNVTVTPFVGPTANTDTVTLVQNSSAIISVLNNDTFGASTVVSSLTKTNPTHGTATVNNNNTITYTPTVGYSGADSFTYTVKDANNKQSTATVNITVTPFVSPTANADTATTGTNIVATIDALANDIAGSGTISAITIVNTTNGSSVIDAYKRIVFTPANNFTGTAVVTYTVTNSNGKSDNSTVTITVVTPTSPTAGTDNGTTAKNTPITINVLNNDSPGNSALAYLTISTAPQHGTAVINADNTITYTPATNYVGTDSFNYRLYNAYGLFKSATVNLTVITPSSTGLMCGTYTVGTGGNYATITAAVADLNSRGVQCPVTFLLTNALYNNATGETFPIVINQSTGTSITNTVTFKPATGKYVTIEATNINGSTGIPAIFKLYGADNVIFDGSNAVGGTTRNLTLNNKDVLDYSDRAIIWIASTTNNNGANNISVKYTNLKMYQKNGSYAFCAGIFSGGNGGVTSDATATANNSNLTVSYNDFTNVKQGIYVNGGSNLTTGLIIHQNDLGAENNEETIIQPACINNVNGFQFTENAIYRLYRNNSGGSLPASGIYVSGASQNGYILKNDMKTLTKTLDEGNYFGGVVLNSTIEFSNIVVANNFIADVAGPGAGDPAKNGSGILLTGTGGGYKIYNNTVSLNTNQTGNGFSSAIFIDNGIKNFEVKNNIFANNQTTGTQRCAIIIYKALSNVLNNSNFVLDYNNYSSSDKIGYIGTNPYDTSSGFSTIFSTWQSATGKDAHSSNIIPVFTTATDLHIDTANAQNVSLNNTGTPLTLVTKDIDGQKRNTATPDMGADEWGVLTLPQPGSNDGIYCDSSTTYSATLWSNGTNWSNGEPTAFKDVIFNGDYTKAGGTFNACSIYVLAGANVNFTTNANVIVQHTLNIATGATFAVESGSNLIQVENDKNAGTAVIKRNSGFLKRLDYTMWSAPVTDSRTTGYQSLATFSPFTSASRFYQFVTANNVYQSITAITTTKFALGKGYLIRMPNAINGTPNNAYYQGNERISFAGAFQGTPNNGNIKIALEYGAAPTARYNAIGNPYPSPISIRDFLTQNIDVIDATMYFWRKTNDSEQTTYSVINLTGYSANQAPGGTSEDGNLLIKDPYTIDADKGVLNTGQGFIVEAKGAKEVVFRNNMRVQNNSQYFFKTAQDSTSTATENAITEGRVWLNVTNTLGGFSQAIVAYNPATTLEYDNGYDGKALAAGNISLYSVLQTQTDSLHLIIQSRGSFTVNDTVAMGYTAATAGQFDIAIDHKDGVFSTDQAIYLVDTFTGSMRNLTDGSYTFTTEAGTFNNRFKIIYALKEQLGTDTPVVDAKQLVVYRDGKQINVEAPATIKSVTVFDMLGKNVYTKNNIDNTTFATDSLNVAQQVLIIQITLDNNQVVSKKIMMN